MFQGRTILIGETIKPQTDDFGKRLEGLVRLICEYVRENPRKGFGENHPLIKQLEKMIFDRLKIKTEIVTDGPAAAILPFYSNRNHILLNDWLRGRISVREQNKTIEAMEAPRGTVNIEKATVGGLFSEYAHPLYLNFHTLVYTLKLSEGAITAAILHELGHAFKACYFSDRADRTNQTLAAVARHLRDNEKGDLEYVYRELSKVSDKIKKEEVDRIVNGTRIIAGAQWFRTMAKIVRTQTLDDTYNKTSFEAEADSFASRFGYGRELIEALEVFHKGGPEKNSSLFYFTHFVDTLWMAVAVSLVFVTLGWGSVFFPIYFMLVTYLTVYNARADVKPMVYDDLKDRYKRIRNDAIDQIKDTKLSPRHQKHLLEVIASTDETIKNTYKVKPVSARIASFFFANSAKAEDSIEDQQILEALSANDLFVEAAKLKQA